MTSTPPHGQGWVAICSRIASVLAIVTPSAWAVLPRSGPDGGVCHAGERARGAGCVDAAVFGLLHHGGLAPCSRANGWGPARPGAAHGHGDAAHHGPGPNAELRRLSPRPQPGTLVLSRPRAPAVTAAGGRLRADRAGCGRHRRHH